MDQQVGQDTGLSSGAVTVRAVRCRTRRSDRSGPRVHHALHSLNPDAGLPRSAILVVRRLHGSLSGNPPRVDGVDLRAIASRAHRTHVAPPPADCDAVLFTDEAELLLCLCRDVAQGRPLGWWWRAVLGRAAAVAWDPNSVDRRAAVVASFDRLSHAIPAVAAVAPSAVALAASQLTHADLLRVAGAMAQSHGAQAMAGVLRCAWQQALVSSATRIAGGRMTSPAAPASAHELPPPRTTSYLGADLLVPLVVDTAIRLHRDPAKARGAAAASTLAARLAAVDPWSDHEPSWLLDNAASPESLGTPQPRSVDRRVPRDSPLARDPERRGGPRDPVERPTAAQAADQVEETFDDPLNGTVSDRLDVNTALGGAFYLLNLLERLGLPDSADGPGEPAGLLTRWGVLALVIRAWPNVDVDDPLLGAIDALAWPEAGGRSASALHPDEPWTYRRPPFSPVGPLAVRPPLVWWHEHQAARLVVAFRTLTADPGAVGAAVLADIPAGECALDDEESVLSECRRVTPASNPWFDPICASGREHQLLERLSAWGRVGAGRWGARVADLLRALLAQVGLDASVVQVPARVELTGFSVRVHMALDDIDLRVRRAGLDRDPGWVPALGRLVELVFL